MLTRDGHDRLVGALYASASGEIPWCAALALFADQFSSSAALFNIFDASMGLLATENHGYSKEFSDEYYASEAYANDPRVPAFQKVSPGTVYSDHLLFDAEELTRNKWCRESNEILGVSYSLGVVMTLPNHAVAGLSILSSEKEGHASPSAIQAFRRLVPHIQQACSLGYVLELDALTRLAMLEALERKVDGVILLNSSAAPAFMNDAARQIICANDGLRYDAGEFVAARASETRHLQKAIGDAVAACRLGGERPGGRMLITRPSGRRPFVVNVMPAPLGERFLAIESIACVIHIHDLARESIPSPQALRNVFGLSEREADFAVELMRCAGLERAAANAGMAVNTARNHLQSILKKTGTHQQAQVIQLLSRVG